MKDAGLQSVGLASNTIIGYYAIANVFNLTTSLLTPRV